MLVETQGMPFRKARSVNATDSSFPAKAMTETEPKGDAGTATGASIIDLCTEGAIAQNGMVVMPYALGADNDTFNLRVYGWRKVGTENTTRNLWRPCLLVEVACTISADVGVAGCIVLNTERFADTIALTTGNDDITVSIISPTGDVAGHFTVDLEGFQKAELTFDLGATAPTSMNALIALI